MEGNGEKKKKRETGWEGMKKGCLAFYHGKEGKEKENPKQKNTPKTAPRDTQINTSVNAQETQDRRARSPCGVNREMSVAGEKKFPDLLQAFVPFSSEPNCLRRACACAGPAAHAEEHEQSERSRLRYRNPI